MNSETKKCHNCQTGFTIEPDDFVFYDKIKVPPPTWCPRCRFVRRMSWRNTWHLFKKQEALKGEMIFSAFPPESPVKIYDQEYWWSDEWDPLQYGREIDWSRPFLEQFRELLSEVPLPAHSTISNVNCDYCTNISFSKNCYLVRAASYTEDSAYLIWDSGSRQCMDGHMTDHCELGYGNLNVARSYRTTFSVNCEDCQEVILSKDCTACQNCVGCIGLRGKSYHIFNQPYSKEEYAEKLKELDLGSWEGFRKCRRLAQEVWAKFPVKYMQGFQNSDVIGEYIYNSKNVKYCYRVREGENMKYCTNILSGPAKDCYDYSNFGAGNELVYESVVCGNQTSNVKFTWNGHSGSKNISYCVFCHGDSDIFGCVSLRKKQYCILNKQYSKEEYEELVPKVIEHMNVMPYVDSKGREYRYGEFFPMEMSPFPFNITEAHEFYPKTKEEAVSEGLKWFQEEKKQYAASKSADDLPDHIGDAGEEILKEIISCAHEGACAHECSSAFRIIPQELQFLKQLNIPLPRLCPNCRHYERLTWRNPPTLQQRQCQCGGGKSKNGAYENSAKHFHGTGECPNSFQTSYAPDRPEIVYCDQCYQAEVV